MAGTLEVDSGWVVETLNKISVQVAVLPAIESHLKKQNDQIDKQTVRGAAHEMRLRALERNQKASKKRWAVALDLVLKLAVAIAAPLMLLHVFGVV